MQFLYFSTECVTLSSSRINYQSSQQFTFIDLASCIRSKPDLVAFFWEVADNLIRTRDKSTFDGTRPGCSCYRLCLTATEWRKRPVLKLFSKSIKIPFIWYLIWVFLLAFFQSLPDSFQICGFTVIRGPMPHMNGQYFNIFVEILLYCTSILLVQYKQHIARIVSIFGRVLVGFLRLAVSSKSIFQK